MHWCLDIPPTFAGASKNASMSFVQSTEFFLDVLGSSLLTFSSFSISSSTSKTGGERTHGHLLDVPVKG